MVGSSLPTHRELVDALEALADAVLKSEGLPRPLIALSEDARNRARQYKAALAENSSARGAQAECRSRTRRRFVALLGRLIHSARRSNRSVSLRQSARTVSADRGAIYRSSTRAGVFSPSIARLEKALARSCPCLSDEVQRGARYTRFETGSDISGASARSRTGSCGRLGRLRGDGATLKSLCRVELVGFVSSVSRPSRAPRQSGPAEPFVAAHDRPMLRDPDSARKRSAPLRVPGASHHDDQRRGSRRVAPRCDRYRRPFRPHRRRGERRTSGRDFFRRRFRRRRSPLPLDLDRERLCPLSHRVPCSSR